MSFAPETQPIARPEALLRVPVGLSSPLWGFFAGAAVSGTAFWLMTRWARPQNLEAMFGKALIESAAEAPEEAAVEAVVEAEVVAFEAPAPEPSAEAPASSDAEPVAEFAAEPLAEAAAVAEAMIEPPVSAEPVGGEAAPIAPVPSAVAADDGAPAPKARARKTEPKAD